LPNPYRMSNLLLKKITIYLTVDERSINNYFNEHDPAPMYKRQLSHVFEQYISSGILAIKRYSVVRFKLVCAQESDKEFIEPLMHAIRRHYSIQKAIKEQEFSKFKKRTFKLLAVSMTIVMLCQGFFPILLEQNERVHSAFSNAIDVFSWVILWKPIEKLIFYWNPFLKEISIYNRMVIAESIVVYGDPRTMSIAEPVKQYA
jgi:hypothetical protein